jgi:hypothetical protein
MKGKLLLLLCAAACLSALPKQSFGQKENKSFVVAKKSIKCKTGTLLDLLKAHPALQIPKMSEKTVPSLIKKEKTILSFPPITNQRLQKAMIANDEGQELWGHVISQKATDWDQYCGIYKFNATATPTTQQLVTTWDYQANGGGGIVDGIYHFVYLDLTYAEQGVVSRLHYRYDTESWEQIGSGWNVDSYKYVALETAQNQITGKVYGEFYNDDASGMEFGVIDYNNMTRTTIGTATNVYVALGLTSDGYLYGVAKDGNCYKINSTNGKETLIGSTGVQVCDANGKYYNQSGEIDQSNDTFYWACTDADGLSSLYTVDLSSGKATKLGDFVNSDVIVNLLFPIGAENGAPAKATDLAATFKGSSTNGTFAFTAPLKTIGDEDLNGDLKYTVVSGNDTLAAGNAAPGESVTCNVNVKEGMNNFVVKTINKAGVSPAAKLSQWVGYDIPNGVTNANMALDNATGMATLTWHKPDGTLNGGYMGDITYNVVRYPDSVMVLKNSADTIFKEILPGGRNIMPYYYGITAINGTQQSEEVKSNSQAYGSPFEIPYRNTFKSKDDFSLFTVIDVNGDNCKWKYYAGNSLSPAGARYESTYKNHANDWLITPPLHLKAGRQYNFYVSAYSTSGKRYNESIEAKLGTKAMADAMTTNVIDSISFSTDTTVSNTVTIDKDGIYYFGIHNNGNSFMSILTVDEINITAIPLSAAPDSVTNLTIAPDKTGKNCADIKFNAPTKSLKGEDLKSISKIEVRCDDKIVHTFINPASGEALSYRDTVSARGAHLYEFTPYNDSDNGKTIKKSLYVGLDKPSNPTNIRLKPNGSGYLQMTWDKVSNIGANGGVVVPDDVVYVVYDDGTYYANMLDSIKGKTYYDSNIKANEGTQELIQLGLSNVNDAGRTKIFASPTYIIGSCYDLPFKENLTGGKSPYLWWTSGSGFGLSNGESSDGDGYCFDFTSPGDDAWSYINTGKISLKNATNPKLVFDNKADAGATIVVEIQKPDGSVIKVDSIHNEAATDWNQVVVNLDKSLSALDYVMVKFHTNGIWTTHQYIDNVMVINAIDDDMSINLKAPKSVKKGKDIDMAVEVNNMGGKSINNYGIKIYDGDNIIVDTLMSKELLQYKNSKFTFKCHTSILDRSNIAQLRAEVVNDKDMNKDNNTSETSVELIGSTLPKPENVAAAMNGSDINITWEAPSSKTMTTTEDFEDYSPWTNTDFGSWTNYDADGKETTTGITGYSYPNEGNPFAYIIFNPSNLGLDTSSNSSLAPHSGNQYAVAFAGYDADSGDYLNSDKWLISPELSGKEQTITFYVNNINQSSQDCPETFEVLCSKTDKSVASFTVVKEKETLSSGVWTEEKVTLPADSKYFAIHCTSDGTNSFMFLIDDVTYEGLAPELTGYNVYVDGILNGKATPYSISYTCTGIDYGKHTIDVTALYGTNESEPGSTDIVTTNISTIDLSNGTFDVYTLDGKTVGKGLHNLKTIKHGIYIINGKKVAIM